MAIDILVVEDEYTEREQLTLLWAGIARLCAESAHPPPERLTTEGIFAVEQLCRRIQTVCEDVRCQLVLVRDSEHPLVQAALTAIQLRFREPLKLETVAKEQYVNAAYLGRISGRRRARASGML